MLSIFTFVGDAMTEADIEFLALGDDRIVRIFHQSGEVITGKVSIVNTTEQELIIHLVGSTNNEKYSSWGPEPAMMLRFDEIESVEDASLS
jgi:hypothetical protein